MAKVKKMEKVTYDPEGSYQWEPSDLFEITGEQFSALINTLRFHVNNSGGAPAVAMIQATSILEDILKEGVEQGVIRRMENVPINNGKDLSTSIEGLPMPKDLK